MYIYILYQKTGKEMSFNWAVLENVGPGHDMNGTCQLQLNHDTLCDLVSFFFFFFGVHIK